MGIARASDYGDTFAHLYDSWYSEVSDVAGSVAALSGLAAGRRVLELGVGTGRIALPLAQTGLSVVGLDASQAMLAQCRAKPGTPELSLLCGDMACLPVVGAFGLVFVNFNTFFNLVTESAQRACLAAVSGLIADAGTFVVEAFVPSGEPAGVEYHESDRDDGDGGRVLTVSTRDPRAQTVTGVHIHTPAVGPTQRLPWSIRYLHPSQLDELCTDVGLTLVSRWGDWAQTPFTSVSEAHISVYTLVP